MSFASQIARLTQKVEELQAAMAAQSQRSYEPLMSERNIMGRVVSRASSCGCDEPDDCEAEVWNVELINVATDTDGCSVSDLTITRRNTTKTIEALAPPNFGISEDSIVFLYHQPNDEWRIIQKYGSCGTGAGSGTGSGCNSGLCGPEQVSAEFVTSVTCVDGAQVVCTREMCLPAGATLGTTDCGGANPGSGVPGDGEVSNACCPGGIPETLTATVTHDCTSISSPTTVMLTWNGSYWNGSAAFGSDGITVHFYCVADGTFTAFIYVSGIVRLAEYSTAGTCNPLAWTSTVVPKGLTTTGCTAITAFTVGE